MPGTRSQIETESIGVNSIFANKGNWGKILGAPIHYLNTSCSLVKPTLGSISLTAKIIIMNQLYLQMNWSNT